MARSQRFLKRLAKQTLFPGLDAELVSAAFTLAPQAIIAHQNVKAATIARPEVIANMRRSVVSSKVNPIGSALVKIRFLNCENGNSETFLCWKKLVMPLRAIIFVLRD